jgi:hypothetical protein
MWETLYFGKDKGPNLHTEEGRRVADETAPERQGLRRVPGHRDTNKINNVPDGRETDLSNVEAD